MAVIYFELHMLFNLPSFFFFGSDPKPDEPDVIDESSRIPPTRPGRVLTLDVGGITPVVRPGNGVFSTPTIISLPKSSRDAIFLLIKFVGLQCKIRDCKINCISFKN